MNYQLTITMASPAGNRTALVEGEVLPQDYAAVGAALLRDPALCAEQVGFVCRPLQDGLGRLEMMGGEFCGNAARSFGLWLGRGAGKKAGEEVPIEISGSQETLFVLLEEDGSWVSMPPAREIAEVSIPSGDGPASSLLHYPAIVLEGITHVILEDTDASEELARAVILQAAEQTTADAAGAIFVRGDQMTPAVSVRATDSFIWESSCGSGTLAATISRSRFLQDGAFKLSLKQPGGILQAEAHWEHGHLQSAKIGGPVLFEAPVTRELSL